MCITGCAPKAGMRPVILETRKSLNNLEMFRDDPAFMIKELDLDLKPIAPAIQLYFDGKWSGEDSSWKHIVMEYTKEQLKDIKFKLDDYLYQGCILYCSGGVKHMQRARELITYGLPLGISHGNNELRDKGSFPLSLRSVQFMQLKAGSKNIPEVIKFIFVFAHNSNIKGYFYQAANWIHIISHELASRFTHHHKSLIFENVIEGVRVFYLKKSRDISDWLKNRIIEVKETQENCCVICDNKEIEKELTEFIEYNFAKNSDIHFALMDTIL